MAEFKKHEKLGVCLASYLDIMDFYGGRPLRDFQRQRSSAKHRGIEWKLTFAQWWLIWLDSGRYPKRGRLWNQYVMARKGDLGAYEVGNVEIQLPWDNVQTRVQRKLTKKARVPASSMFDRSADFTEDIEFGDSKVGTDLHSM